MAEYSKAEMEKLWGAVEHADDLLEESDAELGFLIQQVEQGEGGMPRYVGSTVIAQRLQEERARVRRAKDSVAEIGQVL